MKILVTGGCGFVGSNVAASFAKDGHDVTVIDNLSRTGVRLNEAWLEAKDNITIYEGDIAEISTVDADVIFHFAAQVGVQSSIADPRHDFLVNAKGTFDLLEAVRASGKKPLFVFASTNKVYGDFVTHTPVSEQQPLSFCTPYGCSKGSAEQYVLDYARIFDIPGVVLRMSCIYGTRQFGTEEQGWLAHFARSKQDNQHITLYGDGTQIRDVLFIDDYVRLMHTLVEQKEHVAGQVFNIGGGQTNAIAVNDAFRIMQIPTEQIIVAPWRPADQHYYVSDLTKITSTTGWEPQVSVEEGLQRLSQWVSQLSL